MADRTSADLGAQAQFAGVDAVLARIVEAVEIAGAGARVGQRDVAQRIGLVAAAHAEGGPAGQLVAEVMLGAQRTEHITLVGVRPGLGVVGAGVGRRGHVILQARREADVRAGALELVLLPAHVGGQARVGRAPIQAQRHQAGTRVLVVDGGVAAALRHVQAHAGAVARRSGARCRWKSDTGRRWRCRWSGGSAARWALAWAPG